MQDKAREIKVKRDPDGDITDVVLENGNVYSINEAVMMAEDGLLSGVHLKSDTEAAQENNIDNLPGYYFE